MKTIMFQSTPISENGGLARKNFTGVLDLPSLKKISIFGDIAISGWLIPIEKNTTYKIRIDCDDGTSIEVAPNTPRPDVMKKLAAPAFNGDEVFKGFSCKIPFTKQIKLYVLLGDDEILWKELNVIHVEFDLMTDLTRLLSTRYLHPDFPSWNIADRSTRSNCIECEFSLLTIVDEEGALDSKKLTPVENGFFINFARFLSKPELFKILLDGFSSNSIEIPGPFSESKARLIRSFFDEINVLVFECDNRLFYIGQCLHTADFVYFPDRSLVLRLTHSHYNHQHVKRVITTVSYMSDETRISCETEPSGNLGGVIINGVSPYHFFYDTLPALYVAGSNISLRSVDNFYSLNGGCYFPLQDMFDLDSSAKNIAVTSAQMSNICQKDISSVFVLAGLSYKSMDISSLDDLDQTVICAAKKANSTPTIDFLLDRIEEGAPVFWVGISAQKRSWVNQEEVIAKTLCELHGCYPNMVVIFDGMTSSIFGEQPSDSQFEADREIATRIANSLPPDFNFVDVIGFSSQEKLSVCRLVDFFIANYSTGSMYPSRFYRLPGVVHLSNNLFKAVKDIHIHYNAHIVPFDYVVDIPDPDCPRIDFVSYSIQADKFVSFVCDMVLTLVPVEHKIELVTPRLL